VSGTAKAKDPPAPDEGYGKVAEAFRRNVVSGREIGAAVAVYRDGRAVVDLWGGLRNDNTSVEKLRG
jgi:Beta-lactamase